MKKRTGQTDVYAIITDMIIDLLEKGVVPWHKPWNGTDSVPRNLVSGKAYRGINAFLLACVGGSPYWLTFNQAKQKGGSVRKGEKGVPVVFWKWLERNQIDTTTGEVTAERIPFLRYYTVFNLNQIDGIEAPQTEEEKQDRPAFDPIAQAQAIIDNMPNRPTLSHGGNRAFYRPSTDSVQLPCFEDFETAEEYYSTSFHELIHSTGHHTRLNRPEVESVQPFGSTDYSKEELVAEMGAAFLSGVAEIADTTIQNSAAYIQGWLSKLRSDKKFVVCAAAQAQRASDYILGVNFTENE